MILVQACVHMLGRIERTLGLPQDRTHPSGRESPDLRGASGDRMGDFRSENEEASTFRRRNVDGGDSYDHDSERVGQTGSSPEHVGSSELLQNAIKQDDMESQKNDRRGGFLVGRRHQESKADAKKKHGTVIY